VAAHVEALRDDMSGRLAILGATLASTLIAIGVFMVTALLLSLSVAASLVALGVPWWLALWAITLAAGAIGIGFALSARAKARPRSLLDLTHPSHRNPDDDHESDPQPLRRSHRATSP